MAKKNLPDFIRVASIGKPHGIKGGLSVRTECRPCLILTKINLYTRNHSLYKPVSIIRHEQHHNKLVCYFEGVSDRDVATTQTGWGVYANRELFFKQYPEQFYGELCQGYKVVNLNNQYIGSITSISLIEDINIAFVVNASEHFNLPITPETLKNIDHSNQIIQLAYSPI